MLTRKIIVLGLLVTFVAPVFAVEPNKIVAVSMKESLELAKKRNIDLTFESLDIKKAQNDIKRAGRFQNPSVFSFNNFGAAGRSEPQLAGISQPIEVMKRSARKNLEKANLEFVKDSYESRLFSLDMAVREAYINLIIAKSILAITEEQHNILQGLLSDLLNINDKTNEEEILEIMQAEIALNLNLAKVNTAKANVEKARLAFNKALNVKNGDEITYDCVENTILENREFRALMTPDLKTPPPELNEFMQISFKNRLDLKIDKSRIEVAEKKLTLAIRQRIPDFEVTGGYSFQYANQTEGQRHLSGAFAGVSLVNIPVFYRHTPEIENAKIELEQAALRYASTQNIAEHQLKSAYEKFTMARANLEHFDRNIVDKSDEVLRISKKSFEKGKSTITTFILIEQSHIDVQMNYIEALAEYYRSWIDLLKAVDTHELLDSKDL